MEEKRYYQKEIETMPLEEIRRVQSEKIVKQVRNVYDNVKYYRDLMDEKGVKPEDIKGIEDIHKLPFVSKSDLREAYPFGMLARPLSECVRIHSTSGTTGKRVVAYYTQHDIDLWDECCARAIVAAGGDENDVCQVSYGFGLFTGGAGLNGGSHKVGCLTLPMSSGNTTARCSSSWTWVRPFFAAHLHMQLTWVNPWQKTAMVRRTSLSRQVSSELSPGRRR